MENVKPIDPYKEFASITGTRVSFKSSAPYIPQYVISNLTATSDPGNIYANRVQGRQILLENPVRDARKRAEEEDRRQKAKEAKRRKKLNVIGKLEAKEKGVWKLDKAHSKYRLFIPLHHFWMSYMSELLGLSLPPNNEAETTAKAIPPSTMMHPKLIKADFHGAIMTVRRSKNPCLVGLSGIVIHETENVFKVITKSNAVKLLPKQNSIFVFAVPLYSTLPPSHDAHMPLPLPEPVGPPESTVLDRPHFEFELYGNQFRFRAADRAGRKFKHKESIEL